MQAVELGRVLFEMSIRNLASHKLKSAIVGSLMFFGTALVVVGTSLVDTIEASMAKSVTSSLAGHLQVYSSKAKDKLAIFGSMMMGKEDHGRMDDFALIKDVIAKVPNVRAVVPMGIDIATVTTGNETDNLGTGLRAAHQKGDKASVDVIVGQIRAMAEDLKKELSQRLKISAKPEEVQANIAIVDRALSDELWAGLATDPESVFQFVETKLAPMQSDGLLYYFRYVGTDVDRFKDNFETFKMAKGEIVPPGKRGFLFADKFYEDQIKHKVARDLDKLHREVTEYHRPIAGDPVLVSLSKQIPKQQRRILVQLDRNERALLSQKITALLPDTAGKPLDQQLAAVLTVDDSNIVERHEFFYDVIAPMVELYQVKIGDMMTVRAFSQSGYLTAVNVKVYGTFSFEGLERSVLAGSTSIMDMMTFRDLYGLMSAEKRAEVAALKAKVGTKDLERNDVEDALFGGDDSGEAVAEVAATDRFDEFAGVDLKGERARMEALVGQAFDQAAIEHGVALNAAIMLADPTKLEETRAEIQKALTDAKLDMQVVDWLTASGMIGQFIYVLRGVLAIAIFVIFLVTIVIINNSMVMATMDRVPEIGTMRAIGAQRSTVMIMVLTETTVLGLLSGGLGALAGAGIVSALHAVGIPAGSADIMVFLFAGPRLHPTFAASNLLVALLIIMVVSIVSTLYPALMASRIQPVVAMQAKE